MGEHRVPKSCRIPWADQSEPGAVIPWWYWPISYMTDRQRLTREARRAYEAEHRRRQAALALALVAAI